MARIAVVSGFACGLSWWRRLHDEGTAVRVWIEPSSHKTIGDGIVHKCGTFDELVNWAKEGQRLGEPTLVLFDSSGLGDKADQCRKAGLLTVGGGSFADKLEKDREFGFRIAEEAGCALPAYEQFKSLSESIDFAQKSPLPPVYFKSDRFLSADATKSLQDSEHLQEYFEGLRFSYGDNIKHILQEKIEGVALSTARWWNGMSWVGPYESTYEHKAFLNDDLGGSTGCSFNAVFFHEDDPPIAQALGWERLANNFRRYEAPPGLYDMNALVSEDGEVYFLEWTPRLGYDSELASMRLIPDLSAWLFAIAEGTTLPLVSSDISYCVRLTVPPYPWEEGKREHKGTSDGTLVRAVDGYWEGQFLACQIRHDQERGLCVAGPEGIVGVSIATGPKLEALHDEVIEYAKMLHKRGISALQFRTDGATAIKKDAEAIKASGHAVHPGLLG